MRVGEFLKILYRDLQSLKGQAVVLIILSLAIPALDIVAPALLGKTLALVVAPLESGGLRQALGLLLAFLSINILKALLTSLQLRVGFKVDANILAQLRARLMKAILRNPHGIGAGQMSSISLHLQAVSSFWNSMLWESLSSVLFFGGTAIVLLAMDWQLAIVAFIPVPVVLVLVLFLGPRFRKSLNSYLSGVDSLSGELIEVHDNREFIRVSRLDERVEAQFDRHNQNVKYAAKNVGFWTATYAPIFDLIASLATVILILFYALFLSTSSVTRETFLTFFVYLAYFYRPLYAVSALNENWQRTFAAYRTVENLWSPISLAHPERALRSKMDLQKPTSRQSMQASIIYDEVRFGYEGKRDVFKGLSAHLPAKKRIGIIGPNGFGKSTLLKLTMGLIEPMQGRVIYDRESPKFAYLPQTVFLHSGSVISNLLLVHPEFNLNISEAQKTMIVAEIMTCGEQIGVVEKLKGLDLDADQLSSAKMKLSGGQKQLIGLWRFAIQGQFADYLIMDEPDAYLDIEGLNHVLPKVFECFKGKTMMIVSHNARIIDQCELVFSLSEGQLQPR